MEARSLVFTTKEIPMRLRTQPHSTASLAPVAALVWCCAAGQALAQSAEGSVYGRGLAGSTVELKGLDSGLIRRVVADATGRFSFSRLQPGRYHVSSGGIERDVVVVIGAAAEVALLVQAIERVEIAGRAQHSLIDITSFESTSVFSAEQLRGLPVQQSITAVALLAPGVVKGDPGFGGLPAIGGASVAENAYFINGFDVTNIRKFVSYASLPFDAIDQQQVKTGGYGAEHGRSLGGVVSVLTRRGGNSWKFGASVEAAPDALRARGRDVADRDPEHPPGYTLFQSANGSSSLKYTLHAGGPIFKDQLFVFGLIEGHRDRSDSFGQSGSVQSRETRPKGLIKIDWWPSSEHSLEYTGISYKSRSQILDFDNASTYATSHDGAVRLSQIVSGTDVSILKYTGSLTPSLTVSALLGQLRNNVGELTGARNSGADCPVVLDVSLDPVGCWTPPFPGATVRDPDAPPYDSDTRKAARLDVEYLLGKHQLRAGLDIERFASVAGGTSTYSGGYYYRYFDTADGTVNGVVNATPAGGSYVRQREAKQSGGRYAVKNSSFYVEDAWQVTPRWLVYGGLRSESFDNRDANGQTFVQAKHLLAPRLGFAWNVHGDASLKVFGSAGRYFIPVAANTNIRATHSESFIQTFYNFNGRDARTQAPLNLSAQIGTPQVIQSGALPNPGTVADTHLRPMNQDEIVLGLQRAWGRDAVLGAKLIHRRVNDGMDDFCGALPFRRWADDNGHSGFNAGSLATCFLMNPGRDAHIRLDLQGNGQLTEVTVPARYFDLPRYERRYKALELSAERPFDGRWGANASYTWSRSYGTAEGYVQSTLQQDDAGITQDFDFASLTHGAKGALPNDRRHQFKAFGTLALSRNWRLGGNFSVSSGRPISCIGFVPTSVPDFDKIDGHAGSGDYVSPSSYYCVNPQTGKSELVPRGSRGRTPWTRQLDAQVAYTPKLAHGQVTLQLDVFNVFNTQRITRVSEVADYSRSTVSAVEGKTNPNYLSPTNFQDAKAVVVTGRWEF